MRSTLVIEASSMAFTIVTSDLGVARVAIDGDLDAVTIYTLRRELSNLLWHHPTRVEVDVSRLRLIDSSGVGLLLSFLKSIYSQGSRLTLCGLQEQPLAILQLLKMERIFAGLDPPN